jgi:hypothetical protein
MGKYKLGLKPVQAQPTVQLCSYYTSALPSVASLKYPLGQPDLIQPHMFKNDTLGDCAIAGSIEEVRLANAIRGVTVEFTDTTAIKNYELITGYNPKEPDTDQGTDVHDLYAYRQTSGLIDADGKRHKIVGYAGLTPGDWDELLVALSLFHMVGIGIEVPDYCEAQFEAGKPWSVEKGHHQIEGGHYIPIVGAQSSTEAQLFTWGALQGITQGFYEKFSNVAVVALTEEMFINGPAAVDFQALQKDLPDFTGPVMSKAPEVA